MSLYRFIVPPTNEQGSHNGTCSSSYGQTYRQRALEDYNSSRAREGLPPLTKMPRGTRYKRIKLVTVERVLPAHWASYLINSDASGLADADKAACDKYFAGQKLGAPVSCSDEPEFRQRNDSGISLATDCLTYSFLIHEEKDVK